VDKRVAKLWAEDLEQNPPQCQGRLHDGVGYCCLGRLCVLYNREHPENPAPLAGNFLPLEVVDWAGCGSLFGPKLGSGVLIVAYGPDLNDAGGMSFPEIAKRIRTHVLGEQILKEKSNG
jgi:hypothetical protein